MPVYAALPCRSPRFQMNEGGIQAKRRHGDEFLGPRPSDRGGSSPTPRPRNPAPNYPVRRGSAGTEAVAPQPVTRSAAFLVHLAGDDGAGGAGPENHGS